MVERKLFFQALKNGNKNLIISMIPHITLKRKDIIKIIKWNMKWQHDFLLKLFFSKKYIKKQQDVNELLFFAIHYNYRNGIRWALKKGADTDTYSHGWYCLSYVSRYRDLETVKLLLEHGANPNPTNDPISTPMAMAVAKPDVDRIDLLQSYGAILSKRNLRTALTSAAQAGRFDLVDHFLLKGAIIQDYTYYYISYSKRASIPKLLIRDFAFNLHFHPKYNAFHIAAKLGHINILKEYIKHGRRNTKEEDIPEILSNAMIIAAENGKTHAVKYLISQGADINYIQNGQTVFDKAVAGNYFNLVHMLNERGAKSGEELKNGRG